MTLQNHSNPLKDPELPGRFSHLIIKHMIRLGLSDEQLLYKLKAIEGGARGSISSIRRHKEGTGGQPTTQTIGVYQKALKVPDEEIDELLYPNERRSVGEPSAREFRDQFEELVAELKRQSNLPYEVQRDRAEAKVALAQADFEKARQYLESAAKLTRQTAGHALEEYARSLAALGALAFTAVDFLEARRQYGLAIRLPELSEERLGRYRRSYLIASNAVVARGFSYTEGRKVLDEMIAVGVKPNEVTYNTLINLAPDYTEGRKVLDEMIAVGVKPNEVTYNTLINLAPDYTEGRKVLDEMIAVGVKPNEVTYNTLINLAPDYTEGRKVLDEMIAVGVKPDEVTYNTLINRAPDYTEGRKVLDEMIAVGVKPDEVTYSTLINLAPDYTEGRKVLDEMIAVGVKPDEVTYSTLINLAPDYTEGRKVLDEMIAVGVKPDKVTYNTLINLAPDYTEGRKVLDEMIAVGVKPNEVTYNTLINLAPDYTEGRKVLDEMIAVGVKPDKVTYNTLINLAPDYTEGRKVLDEMIAVGVKPDEVTYNTLINRAPDYTEGRKVLDEMIAVGVKPDEVTYSTLINLAPDYTEGRKVLDEMIAVGVKPDEVTYSTLINLAPDYTEGRKVLDEMIAVGVKPNEVTLVTLVKLAPSFENGCELAIIARDGQNWYTGRGFYEGLFSLPITHLTASELLEMYENLPFKYESALQNPIRQFRKTEKLDEALALCLFAPHLPAAQKLYREEYEFVCASLSERKSLEDGTNNFHYCFGIAAHQNQDWVLARKHLSVALDGAIAAPRKEHIKKMQQSIPPMRSKFERF